MTGPHTSSEGPVHVHSSSVTDGNQGLKTDSEDQVAGLSTNSEGPDHVSSSSINDGNQGLKTEGEDQVAGLHTTSEGPDHVRSSSVDDSNQDLKTQGLAQVAGLNTGGKASDSTAASFHLDVSSNSDDSDDTHTMDDADDEHYQDAQAVTDSFSGKQLLSSSSSSDNSDSSATPGHKRGKRIQRRFETLFRQAEVVNQAVNVPLPVDVDDDLTQDPTLNNPMDPGKGDEHTSMATDFDSTDYPLTQPTPTCKISKPASQPTNLLSPFLQKSTCPQPIALNLYGTSCVLRSQSQTHAKSTK